MSDEKSRQKAAGSWISGLMRKGGVAGMAGLVLPLVGGALLIVQAMVLADVIDRAVIQSESPASLLLPALLVGGLVLARGAIAAAAEAFAVAASEKIKQGLRRALFADLMARGPLWTGSRASGTLSNLIIEHVEALDGFLVRYMPAMVQATLLPLAFAAVVFPIDWVVGVLFLVTAPLIPVFMALAGWGAEAAQRAQAGALTRLTARFADRLRGMVTLKLFNRQQAETDDIHAASQALRRRSMKVMRIAFLSSAVLEFFAALGVAGVALYIGLTFLDLVTLRGTELTLSAGLFCLLMAPEVYNPLRLLAAHYHDRAGAKAGAEALLAELDALPEPDTAKPAFAPAPPHAEERQPLAVSANNLTILSPRGETVIAAAELAIAPGEHVAIMGPSGVGKSTLIEAIARLRAHDGTLTLGSEPIDHWAEADLRAQVALLSQKAHVFAGTIADNIRLGRPDAGAELVRLAAQRACVTDFAYGLPNGLDTMLGENGAGLSGGEIQRIALARLYLRNPGVVLLDEPTAHLDASTEAKVLDGLESFALGRTLVVVTHSRAVAQRMGRTLRIAGGQLVSGLPKATKHRTIGAA